MLFWYDSHYISLFLCYSTIRPFYFKLANNLKEINQISFRPFIVYLVKFKFDYFQGHFVPNYKNAKEKIIKFNKKSIIRQAKR